MWLFTIVIDECMEKTVKLDKMKETNNGVVCKWHGYVGINKVQFIYYILVAEGRLQRGYMKEKY